MGVKRRREDSESANIEDEVSDVSSPTPPSSQRSERVRDNDQNHSKSPHSDASSSSPTPPDLFEVSQILARSVHTANSEHYYLVRWEGYGPEEDSWEPKSNLMPDAGELVEAFDSEEHPFTILTSRQHPAPRTYKVRYGLVTPFTPPSPMFTVEWHTPSQMKAKMGISLDSIMDCLQSGIKGKKRPDGPLTAANGRGKDAMSYARNIKISENKSKGLAVRPTLIDILNVQRKKAKATSLTKHVRVSYQVRSRYKNLIKEEWVSRETLIKRFGRESLKFFENGGNENQDVAAETIEVNEYEVERLRNIEENKALMANLGLAM